MSKSARTRRARSYSRFRRALDESSAVLLLVGLTLIATLLVLIWPAVWPVSVYAIPLVLANYYLNPRQIPWFAVLTGLLALTALWVQPAITLRMAIRTVVILVLVLVVWWAARKRSPLGVGGVKAEAMFMDLVARIQRPGDLQLPSDWLLQSALRAAGNTPFNGDFVITSLDREALQLAVVDVSGKGTEAGTRALQLSGALSGLVDALPADRFLSAANDFLIGQDWDEGFATAVHVSVDLGSGAFEVRSAGHLPAIQFQSGSARWRAIEADGPVLGLVDDADFQPVHGVLRPGDSLVLYTDGVVERASEHIGQGIDRLLGQAERELTRGHAGMAERLIDIPGSQDDRTLVLLHRVTI